MSNDSDTSSPLAVDAPRSHMSSFDTDDMHDFDRERQSMPELKLYLRAIWQAAKLVEQIVHLALQLEITAGLNRHSDRSAAEVRNLNDSHLVIDSWLTASNGHVLDSAELVSSHQLH